MFVCPCVCMYVCVCLCVFVCEHVYTHVSDFSSSVVFSSNSRVYYLSVSYLKGSICSFSSSLNELRSLVHFFVFHLCLLTCPGSFRRMRTYMQFLVKLSLAVIQHHGQKQLGEKRTDFIFPFSGHTVQKQVRKGMQESGAGNGNRGHEGCCLVP